MKLPNNIVENVQLALQEDIATGDVTAELIPVTAHSTAYIICHDTAILAGAEWLNETFQQIDPLVKINWHYEDASPIEANTLICTLSGSSRSLLSGERVALNFLQLLSATATQTHHYVTAIGDAATKILDTRKTIPGLRLAQKYAVRCGGGENHRIGLYDRVLIKENHIMAAGSIKQAVIQAKQQHPTLLIEVEAETIDEFQQASQAGADIIMLDNFTLEAMKKVVFLNNHHIKLEASGGVNLDSVRAIAATGVDYISIGQITKDIIAIDLSMRFE
jgi:nicotinate-nucleotide pyrophosphorylase (carboxylating)